MTTNRLLVSQLGANPLFDDLFLVPDTSTDSIAISSISTNSSTISGGNFSSSHQKQQSPVFEIVNLVIAQAIRQNSTNKIKRNSVQDFGKDTNILALGYRSKSIQSTSEIRGFADIELHFINTLHTYVCTPHWDALAREFGESFIQHLLSLTTFLRCDNGCFVQLSGIPASELVRRTSGIQSRNRPKANLPLHCLTHGLGGLTIPRQQMFYKNYSMQKFTALMRQYVKQCGKVGRISFNCIAVIII
jgi:hypothetical protein